MRVLLDCLTIQPVCGQDAWEVDQGRRNWLVREEAGLKGLSEESGTVIEIC